MAGCPNITGHAAGCDTFPPVGAFQNVASQFNGSSYSVYGTILAVTFDASRCSEVYGSSETVTPLSESVIMCISY